MSSRGPGRVAVIGDVGGQLAALTNELIRLGADPRSLALPPDLTIVQVGDLIHRGPDSSGVLRLVDRYLIEQPGQWVQLVGNHEAQYLAAPAFEWGETLDDRAIATLRSWWASGQMRASVAVRTAAGEDFFISHAGLTEGFWRQALDAPPSAVDAARAVNSFIGRHDAVLFHAGQMLGGGSADFTAGPIWASAATELVPSWLLPGEALPFNQLHGHSRIVDWRRQLVRADPEVAATITFDVALAHETATLPGGRIIGVDPGHGRRANERWQAWTTTGTVRPESVPAPL